MAGKWRGGWAVTILAGFAFLAQPAQAKDVLVFAAASLKNALDDADRRLCEGMAAARSSASYGASSALAKQIDSGAAADIFISADLDWMNDVAEAQPDRDRHAQESARQQDRAGRAGRGRTAAGRYRARLSISKGLLKDGKLAMADPTPCRPANTARRRWKSSASGPASQDQVAQRRERARGAALRLRAARRRSASSMPTDAAADKRRRRSSATFPEDSHPPIIYPIAADQPRARPRRPRSSSTYLESAGGASRPSRSRASRCCRSAA